MGAFVMLPGIGKAQSTLLVDRGRVSVVKENASEAPLASTTIVISQAYGGGGGTTGTYIFDYVELKNVSAVAQSLSGLSLMYGSATGQFGSSAGNIFALPAVSLNPGQYYLVQLSAAGTGGAPFPVTPDATTANLSMSGTNGKVALVTAAFTGNTCGATATPCTLPNAAIVDLVAWGTANNAEGGASTNGGAALTSTQGNVRNGAGCTDTDNNNADFAVVTNPVPRNTATAAAPCALAAGVSISGRVTTTEGRGIRNAIMTISGGGLSSPISVHTGPFGRYEFNDIPSGSTYILTVRARRFSFAQPSQVITVNDNLGDLNCVATDNTDR